MTKTNETQREYWRNRRAWVDRQEQMDSQLEVFGLAAIEALGDISGTKVLDVGCGCGHTTLELHSRVGNGKVVGVDISDKILEVARSRSNEAIKFVEADAQVNELGGPYDAIFSRFGVMFFEDPVAAFGNLKAASTSAGRLSFVCWQQPAQNPWMTVPNRTALEFVELPSRAPGSPDPFAFSDPNYVSEVLEGAGWINVEIEDFQAEVELGGGVNAMEAAVHAYDFGPFKAVVEEHPEVSPSEIIEAMKRSLEPYQTNRGVVLPGAVWLVTAQL